MNQAKILSKFFISYYIIINYFSDDFNLDLNIKNNKESINKSKSKLSIVYENEDVYISKCGTLVSFK